MLFNSYLFILCFLPLCLMGYFGLNRFGKQKAGKIFLILMSLWFYAYFNVWYLFIILGSIAVNYGFYRLITARPAGGSRKAIAAAGIAANLAVLFYFKYFNFFVETVNSLFQGNFTMQNILLPLGISFFTFQQIGFLVDACKGSAGRYRFTDYALFVTFFPQLIAGPIVTHTEMIPQFQDEERKKFRWDNLAKGVYGFSLGLAKKVLIADTLGIGAAWGFSNSQQLNGLAALMTMLSYTLQLYFDFSGYCDMARGIGCMMNIDIPLNFNSPYKAVDLIDFWKRWHITLGRFFTQNVYIPLGGSRKGTLRTYGNIFIIYLLSGIWHGAGWTFIIWGTLHGAVYMLNRALYQWIRKIPKAVTWFVNMVFFIFSLIFFRAESVGQAFEIIRALGSGDYSLRRTPQAFAACFQMEELWYPLKVLGADRLPYADYYMMFLLVLAGWVIVLAFGNVHERTENMKPHGAQAAGCALLLVWSILSFSGVSTFLYFNF